MAAVTTRIRFCTHVVKVAVRNPLLLAKQVSSAAVLSGNRFTFGAGVGWLKEEFEWCGQPYEGRGARTDESLDAIMELLTGDWVERDGEHVRFGRIKQPPAPTQKVPIYIGGHTPVALRRTVRFGDGWTSAMITLDEFQACGAELTTMLLTAGRPLEGFAYQVAPADRFGLDGYKELEAGRSDRHRRRPVDVLRGAVGRAARGQAGRHPPLREGRDRGMVMARHRTRRA